MRTSRTIAGVLFFFVGLPLALAGCRGCSASPEAAKEDAAGIKAWLDDAASRMPLPPPVGFVEAGVDGQAVKPSLSKEERLDFDRFQSKMTDGRKATRDKRFDEAESAFTRAIGVRPADARAHAERGYARLLAGDLAGASEDLDRALTSGVDATLGAQVYFNLGLLREKQKNAEAARSAFAIANALAPSAAARAKLGGLSPCTAEIDEQAGSETLTQTAGWETLSADIAPDKDLGDPKKSVCIRTHTATADPEDRDVCNGEPPWTLVHHHQWFTEEDTFVVPRKGGAGLLYWRGRVGSWPAHCVNLPSPSPTVEGDLLRISFTFDGVQASLDQDKPLVDDVLQCNDTLAYKEDVFYDLRTGKRVLRVYVPAGVPSPTIAVNASASGSSIRITGAGCDRTLRVAAP